MIRLALSFLMVASAFAAGGQCRSGNCENGKGSYDFGWCSYEGTFRNGKPDGQGSMKYSDYTYTGSFHDGVEDGDGSITYADGKKEAVRYIKGQKVAGPPKLAASEYKGVQGRDPGCISGDCNNGFGTYQFPSGNRYVGNFKDKAREGKGTFYFTNGEQFAGTFQSNSYANGTYTFSTGATYTGTYDAEGKPVNGVVRAGQRSVPISNGKAIVPKQESYGYENTAATRKAAEESRAGKTKTAPINWGSSSSDYEHQRGVSEKAASDVQKMLDRMDRPTYTHW